MRKQFVISIFLPLFSLAQQKNKSFEIVPKVRYDNYADFDDQFSDRSYTTRLKLKGVSWGLDVKYSSSLNDKWSTKVGIGYYRYTFNKMSNYNPIFRTTSKSREINLVRPVFIIYGTDKYWYNSINFSVGIDRNIPLQSKYEGVLGLQVNNFMSFTQRYNVPGDNSIEKKSNLHYYAFSGLLNAGINRTFSNFYLGSHLALPVFDMWSDDKTLSHVPGKSRRKWANGVGVNFVIGFYLKKSK